VCVYFMDMYGSSVIILLFFFSSRRRHTRFSRDWSSDVCSSDLLFNGEYSMIATAPPRILALLLATILLLSTGAVQSHAMAPDARSEERRVGKMCRIRLAKTH